MKSLFRTLAFVLGTAPLLAQAALIDITVTGTVSNSYDELGNVFNNGVGYGIVNGQTATLNFSYDTASAPGVSDLPHHAYYLGTRWMESSASVGGIAMPVVAGNTYNVDTLDLYDFNPPQSDESYSDDEMTGWSQRVDDFYSDDGQGNFAHRYASALDLFTFGGDINFLNGITLDQTFSLVLNDGSGNNSGEGWISRSENSYDCRANQGCTATKYAVFAEFDLNTATMSRRDNASVPEPATLGLLGIGLAGIGFMRRRRSTAR